MKWIRQIMAAKKDPLLDHFSDKSNQFDLSPVYIEKLDSKGNPNPKYGPVEDIANKLGNENVKNIALTGPYGSGKSSVLRTLIRDYPDAKYLNISLATLEDDTLYKELIDENNKHESQQKRKREKEAQKEKDEINHLIEYSILQQIIYKEKANKLRQSRLKRIQDIRLPKALGFAVAIVLALIAISVLFEPKFLRVESLYSIFSCSILWKKVWDIVCLSYLIGFSVFFIGKILVATYNSKVNKLNFKDGEIGIEENTSIFNKHLDEIVYFFEVTDYNVVVIEDLDRFETNHIFLKLRELNQLLNSSNSIGRRIVFIYAVRDDIFSDTNRTKFFDYITTVIPVINYSNAKDKLIEALAERGVTEIPEKTCKELGLYIDDMRILYNIVDEFLQYRMKLDKGLDARCLLAMIVYKNYFPKDFAELHNRQGDVYRILSNKKKYLDEVSASLFQRKDELEQKIEFEKERYQNTIGKELRMLYVSQYLINTRFKITSFVGNKEKASPQEVIDDDVKFRKLQNNEYSKYEYYTQPYGQIAEQPLNIRFEDVEKQIDPQYSYDQRLNFSTTILNNLKTEKEEIEDKILKCKQSSLSQLLIMSEIESFQNDIDSIKDKNRLIEFLIKQGYINEYYFDYISYFYPGTLMLEDKDYIMDLRVGRKKEYDFQLCKFDSVIEELPEKAYNNGGILNVSLVNYVAEHADNSEMSKRLDRVIKCIVKRKEKEFVYAFYVAYDGCTIFFERLFKTWYSFDTDCLYDLKEQNEKQFELLFEAFVRYVDPLDIPKDNDAFNNQMCNSFEWINEKLERLGLEKIELFTRIRRLTYCDLRTSVLDSELMSFIIDGCYFKCRDYNLLSIVSFLNPNMIQTYQTASMTTIRKLGNKALVKDMDDSPRMYIECFPHESIEESVENLLYILNNFIQCESIVSYLDKQQNKIPNLADVIDNEKKKLAMKTNVVEAKWENVEVFVKADANNIDAEELVGYISVNIDEFSHKDVSVLSDEVREELFVHFVGSNILELSVYYKFRDAFMESFNDFDLSALDSDRMAFLIESRGVMFDNYYYNLILNSFPTLLLQYIYAHFELFMNKLGDYYIPSNVALWLLKDSSIKKKDRMSIVYALSDEIEPSVELAQVICHYYVEGSLDELSEDRIWKYISWLDNKEDKIKTFVYFAEKKNLDNDMIRGFLNELGGGYQEIAVQKGYRPRLEINDYNEKLLSFLDWKRFISSYKEHNNMYQVNTRNL